jgi:VanZ family protein
MNKKKIIMILLVIIWMAIIFYFSSMNTKESNGASKGLISNILDKTITITNNMGITNKYITITEKQSLINKLNYPIRKCAHASVYFILSILIIYTLITINKKFNNNLTLTLIISILICFIYALTDEYHQTFVIGRTGQFKDVIIDTIGATIGSGIYYLFHKKRYRFNK